MPRRHLGPFSSMVVVEKVVEIEVGREELGWDEERRLDSADALALVEHVRLGGDRGRHYLHHSREHGRI
jgi:hypothetical protein